jgi:hypothetical protein
MVRRRRVRLVAEGSRIEDLAAEFGPSPCRLWHR